MLCKICNIRRPRRQCPAIGGEICSPCCGREREVTLNCPLDCEYLRESRKHDRPEPVKADQFPNQDIRVTETFLNDHEPLVIALGQALLSAALETPGAVDFDVREALAALIRTHRTLESGLYYETRPDNTVAAELDRRIRDAAATFRQAETDRQKITKTRDSEVLAVLVFLQRLEIDRNNGRKRGRAFIDFMRRQFPGASNSAPASTPSLIVT